MTGTCVGVNNSFLNLDGGVVLECSSVVYNFKIKWFQEDSCSDFLRANLGNGANRNRPRFTCAGLMVTCVDRPIILINSG